jgi:thioesterase domain-containing protein/acyl carrier protein
VQEIKTSSTVAVLTHIWQRVLQLPAVRPDDNFFDLGGDSALAVQLFAEIAQTCGRQLPPVLIYHVPTIADQADALEKPVTPQLTPIVRLKAGPKNTPIFVAPGLGGGPAEFFQLVKYIDTSRAVYGLQPKGFDGAEEPSDTIEDMAAFYLRAIREVQPHGPYSFFGYSLGGLVAIEMARTLANSGEKTELLVMLDSYPHVSSLSPRLQVRLLTVRARSRVLTVVRGQAIRHGGSAMDRAQVASFAPALDRVTDRAYAALRRYRPVFFPGRVKFVRAQILSNFPEDPVAVWSHIIGELHVETVPGDHLSMLTTHYRTLGVVLTRYLIEAGPAGK